MNRSSARWPWLAPAVLPLVVACQKPKAPSPGGAGGEPPAVVVATAAAREVALHNDYVGRTDASATVEVRARVEGFLERRHFDEGKAVKKGQALYEIDRRTYDANAKRARAALQKAKGDLKLATEQVTVRAAEAKLAEGRARWRKAEQDVKRLRPLAEAAAVPQQDLDNALAALDVATEEVAARQADLENARLTEAVGLEYANASVEASEAELARAELDLSYCAIASPIDGLIGESLVSPGNFVGRGEPTLLATISTIDPLKVRFAISEDEYLDFARRAKEKGGNEKVEIELLLSDGRPFPHKGTFLFAERAVGLQTGTLEILAQFPNPDLLLRPGQFARVRFVARVVPDAVLVPIRAVVERQSAKLLYVVDAENKVAVRTVRLGARLGSEVVVEEGVKAGERVIVEGQLKAVPGRPVRPADRAASEEPAASNPAGR